MQLEAKVLSIVQKQVLTLVEARSIYLDRGYFWWITLINSFTYCGLLRIMKDPTILRILINWVQYLFDRNYMSFKWAGICTGIIILLL